MKRVYQIQEEKECLVILDDIWSTEAWEHKASNSKIVITTQNKAVASHADPRAFLYQPKCLTDDESWELLRKKAFFLTNDNIGTGTISHYPLNY